VGSFHPRVFNNNCPHIGADHAAGGAVGHDEQVCVSSTHEVPSGRNIGHFAVNGPDVNVAEERHLIACSRAGWRCSCPAAAELSFGCTCCSPFTLLPSSPCLQNITLRLYNPYITLQSYSLNKVSHANAGTYPVARYSCCIHRRAPSPRTARRFVSRAATVNVLAQSRCASESRDLLLRTASSGSQRITLQPAARGSNPARHSRCRMRLDPALF
jgi:hypothetical protein